MSGSPCGKLLKQHFCNGVAPVQACSGLRCLETFGRIKAILYKKGGWSNVCDFMFAFEHTNPLRKRGILKQKEFPPKRSKFFLFRVGHFSERNQTVTVASLVTVCMPLNKQGPLVRLCQGPPLSHVSLPHNSMFNIVRTFF